MASYNIQVVLRDDVKHLGQSGDLVKVKPGYARNYLLPRGLAVVASKGNLAQAEHERRLALARVEKQREAAIALSKKVRGTRVTLSAKAGEEGKLFGSISNKDIAEALLSMGYEVERKQVLLESPLKELGESEVVLQLGSGVTEVIKVSVEAARD